MRIVLESSDIRRDGSTDGSWRSTNFPEAKVQSGNMSKSFGERVSMGVKIPPFGETKFPPLVVKRPRLSTPPGCVTEVPPFSFPSVGNSLL